MGVLLHALAAAALTIFTAPAVAKIPQQPADACNDTSDTVTPAERIANCTAAIQSARHDNAALATAFSNRGNGYFEQKNYARAIADQSEAIRLYPNYAEAFYRRAGAYFRRAKANAAQQDYLTARDDYHTAASIEPNNANYRDASCWIRALLDIELVTAREDCDAAVRLAPGNADHLDSRGMVGLRQGRWQDAWNDYNMALTIHPQFAHSLYGRGIAALWLGRTAGGEADIAKAKALDANIDETYAGYGVKP